MASIDSKLSSKGTPKNAQRKDVNDERNKMLECLERQYKAAVFLASEKIDATTTEPGQKKVGWGLIKKISLVLTIIVSIVVIYEAYNKYIRKDREQVLITQGSLDKYISENKHVVELCRRISGLRNVPVSDNGLPALLYPFVISQLNYLGLQTISDIDNTLKKSVDTIAMFAKELNDEMGYISKANCIKILCDFLMAKSRSVDQVIAYYDANSLNAENKRKTYAERIKRAYQRAIKDI